MKRIVALVIVLLLSIAIVSAAGADPFSPTETAKYFNMSADEIMDLNAIDKATFTISLLVDLSGTSEIRFLETNLPHMLSSESYIQLNRPGVITVAFPCDSSILTLIYFADGESEITASYGYFDIPSAEYGKSVIENTISDYKTSVNDPTELVRALLYFKYRSEEKVLFSNYQ